MAEPFKPDRVRAAEPASKDSPSGPSFSDLVKNQTKSPLSLSEFMDYLIYIEHNAENLQFFLWYSDYVQRWSRLPRRQKSASPPWTTDCEDEAERLRTCPLAAHKRANSEKMTNILAILDRVSEKEEFGPPSRKSISETGLSERGENKDFVTSVRLHEYAKQPFRDELTRVARTYIEKGAPRQLKLSDGDRASILEGLQHTTHPTAILPAFTMSSNILREFSHPSFIKWSLYRNANKPRINFTRSMAAVFIVMGLGFDVILTVSGLSTYLRVLGILLLWPGITWLAAAAKGLCLELHFQRLRQQRPWEAQQPNRDSGLENAGLQDPSVDGHDGTGKGASLPSHSRSQSYQNSWYGWQAKNDRLSPDSSNHNSPAGHRPSVTVNVSASVTHSARTEYDVARPVSVVGFSTVITGGHDKSRGHASTVSGVDPPWKQSMQPLGPSNDYSREAWYREEGGSRPSLLRRVFAGTVATRNRDLHLMQDRLVLRAVVLGGLVSAIITCGFLFLPGGNYLSGVGSTS
ncbi:hypothetical protein MGG_03209 [Pyricularia oryzae 70-15]|uniref:RGS domain-containing protein n=1 Tax=Pyricularia oryzae (strain 70-15 / ATCC MYA-4617 / FGSC 8958) TaxID=242507 RepID=G4NAA7_PYRO7|nr:uncharacterized protein MGG_03209 [Pyricularia oryzae 70-15]EHA50452.1 hypothetical protein MGG_03209 [Pyricularia oryzae 70-15]KAI7931396.1 hypothetical protein M9X92_000227 [Pyricularia oryzae]KAI7931574.1 hypothetical protein M0657_001072 [Pyricularia oryzae]